MHIFFLPDQESHIQAFFIFLSIFCHQCSFSVFSPTCHHLFLYQQSVPHSSSSYKHHPRTSVFLLYQKLCAYASSKVLMTSKDAFTVLLLSSDHQYRLLSQPSFKWGDHNVCSCIIIFLKSLNFKLDRLSIHCLIIGIEQGSFLQQLTFPLA